MIPRALAVLTGALIPGAAGACATCLDSAYGSRTFNWAFVGLMLAPFGAAVGLLGGVVWACRRRRGGAPAESAAVVDHRSAGGPLE